MTTIAERLRPSRAAALVRPPLSAGLQVCSGGAPASPRVRPSRGAVFKVKASGNGPAAGGVCGDPVGGRMKTGFAQVVRSVARPVAHGSTGIQSLVVNRDSRALERNLGSRTAPAALRRDAPAAACKPVAP